MIEWSHHIGHLKDTINWIHNVEASSQNHIELSAAPTLKGKEAQTPSNKAFASSKTNTRNIPMLDIIRPAYTVGITTVSAPIGRGEAFSISNWVFFFYNWNCNCPFVRHRWRAHAWLGGATSRRRIYVWGVTNVLLDCSLRFHSYFGFEWGFAVVLMPSAQTWQHVQLFSPFQNFCSTLSAIF